MAARWPILSESWSCKPDLYKSLGRNNFFTIMLPISKQSGNHLSNVPFSGRGWGKGSSAKIIITNFSRANATCIVNPEEILESRFRGFPFLKILCVVTGSQTAESPLSILAVALFSLEDPEVCSFYCCTFRTWYPFFHKWKWAAALWFLTCLKL